MTIDLAKPVNRLLEALADGGCEPKATGKKQWEARCPAHDDQRPSLSVSQGGDGTALLRCHAGCAAGDVVKALGLSMRNLFPQKANRAARRRESVKARIVATYDYNDERGNLVFQTVRYEPKDFKQRRPDRNGGWVWSLKGVRRVLYRLPDLTNGDADRPVYIVEGEKDADALAGLGLLTTCCPLGAGKWSSVDDTPLHDRHVRIIPDNDGPGRQHADDVARRLYGKAASVRIVELPGLLEHGDVSDYLNNGGTVEGLAELAEDAPEYEPADDGPEPRSDAPTDDATAVYRLAERITAHHHFAVDVGAALYVYADGCYRPEGARFVRRLVKAILAEQGASKKWSSHKADEVCKYIATDAPELWERPPTDVVNVRNGLLDPNTRELRAHSSDHLSPVQLPVAYDPNARCPNWERFIPQVFPEDALELAWQVVAWLMLPHTSFQRALLLLGPGANGKSTYLAAVTAFLGKANVAGLSLQRLESNRFSAARLVGKLANICPDLPSEHLAGTSMFKAIVGQDPIEAERKFQDSFDFVPFARLVFSANHPPRSSDASEAFYRRWVVVPFPYTFEGEAAIPRATLDGMLTAPGELSGVLNRALEALPGLLERGFVESESMREAAVEFRVMTDPISVWLDHHTVEEPYAMVTKAELLTAYNRWADDTGKVRLTPKALSQTLKKLRPNIADGQRTVHGKLCRVWLGLGFARQNHGETS